MVLVDRISDFHIAPPNDNDLRNLPTVTFKVALGESLEDIAHRAEREIALDSLMGVNSHFVTAPDSGGRRYLAPFSPYVAADGAFTWVPGHIPRGWGFHSLTGVRVDDVVRTRKEGFFEGDPFALLIEERRGAGGFLPSWNDLNTFFDHAEVIVGKVGSLDLSIRALRGLVGIYREQLELRYATPLRFFVTILERDSWEYARLARLLEISLFHVVDLLTSLGYEQDASDPKIYRLSESVPQTKLRQALENDFLQENPREWLRKFWESQGTHPPGSN